MARRKRRRTQTSRSHSRAAQRWLTLGDTVRVKDEVMDPDYAGYSIGGWSGAIVAFEAWEQTPMALIAWDATTQRDRIDPKVRQRAVSQGLSADQMWLHLSDLERVELVKGGQRSEGQPRVQGVEASAAPWTPPSCGHTYPEVLRLRDEVRADGTFVRITDCRYCGRAEIAFPASILAEDLRRDLEATGYVPGMAEEEIEVVRQREERRRHQRSSAGRWWQRWWWRLGPVN
jgi:hypothetical protein